MRRVSNMRIRRMINGERQTDIAKKLGVTQQCYHLIESGKQPPTEKRAKQLKEHFNESIEYLLSIAE